MEVQHAIPELNPFDVTRFWLSVCVGEPDECWEWQGGRRKKYGRFKVAGKWLLPHRLAYYLQHCTDPGRLLVCHTCDNPICCNGAHLFAGTPLDNAVDRDRKGRGGKRNGVGKARFRGFDTHPERFPRGTRVKGVKLTEEQVREIRSLHRTGTYSQVQLGKQFGVSHRSIGNLLCGHTWAHVE